MKEPDSRVFRLIRVENNSVYILNTKKDEVIIIDKDVYDILTGDIIIFPNTKASLYKVRSYYDVLFSIRGKPVRTILLSLLVKFWKRVRDGEMKDFPERRLYHYDPVINGNTYDFRNESLKVRERFFEDYKTPLGLNVCARRYNGALKSSIRLTGHLTIDGKSYKVKRTVPGNATELEFKTANDSIVHKLNQIRLIK